MHESGLIRDVVHRAEAAARDANAKRIVRISVWLGALSQMSDGHFREHFEQEIPGTLAESAELAVEVSDDPLHPQAQSVMLQAVDLEV